MEEALRMHYERGVRKVAFGDIFLEDLRVYREKNLARMGMTALFPIWKRDTRELIDYFHAQGFRSVALRVSTARFCRADLRGANWTLRSSRICRRELIVRGKWRVSYICVRWTDFQRCDPFSSRRTRRTRFVCFLRSLNGKGWAEK